jgi:hypothetical protein
MSEVYVHGIVDASEQIEVGQAPVRRVVHRGLAAVVSDASAGKRRATDALRTHWRVLEAIAARATVLPVRFGTILASERAVVDDYLERNHDTLAATLAEMAGKVQLSVKGSYDEQALMRGVVAASPPVARLRERVRSIPAAAAYYDRIRLGEMIAGEVQRVRDRDTALVLERLGPLAAATSREPPGSIESAVNTAFLVEREQVDEFSRRVADLGRELQGRMRLRYVGPLPPYSFTGETAPAGVAAWA